MFKQSVLGGIPIPANSAGKVPLNYLHASPSFKARAAYANALQILAELEVKSSELVIRPLRIGLHPKQIR